MTFDEEPIRVVKRSLDDMSIQDLKERIEALSNGTRRVLTINEARAIEGYGPVEGGNEIRVQQQDVPLSYGANLQPPSPAPEAPAPAADNEPDDADQAAEEGAKAVLAFRTSRTAHARKISA